MKMDETLFGVHAVREALRGQPCPLDSVTLLRDSTNPRLGEIEQLARQRGVPVYKVPEETLRAMAGGRPHQGAAGRIMAFTYRSYEEILARVVSPGLLLVLDGIEDPQNLGAVLRSADAAGVGGVFIPERRAAQVTAAVVRASAGAASHIPVSRQTNLTRLLQRLKQDGYWVVGLDVAAARPWTEPDYRGPTVLVLGSEDSGMHRLVRETCDFLVRLPMRGQVQSLNVSVAAGVVLYEALRQRGTL